MKYKTVNVNDDQNDLVERVRDLLEVSRQGPYGGKGESVSKGQAVAFACRTIIPLLEKQVMEAQERKRRQAARARHNNNPGITPGRTRLRKN